MGFIKENSYQIVRLMLFQFAMAVFGIVLIFATRMASDGAFSPLSLIASILSVGLYMYILYATVQELGAKDKIRYEHSEEKVDKFRGLKLMLLAQIPNFIILFFMLLGYLLMFVFGGETSGTNIFGIANVLLYFCQSMYNGIIGSLVNSEPTSYNCFMTFILYLVSVVPGVLVCFGSYLMGLKDKTLFSFLKKKD